MSAPASSSVAAQLAAYAAQMLPALDRYSYYQLLRVAQDATPAAIRAAFYQMSGQIHPDRYRAIPDPALRDKLEIIYARITEAYRVLSAPDKRALYDQGLPSGRLRLDSKAREQTGPKNPEDALKHPEAKKFFKLGMLSLARKDWKGAVMNFNFAKNFEPGAPLIAEKLAEAQAGQKAAAPTTAK